MDWLEEAIQPVFDRLTALGRNKLAQMYRACFRSTWDTTLQRSDGTVFLVTGDIPAMWLRDSSAQVYHYVPHAGKYREVSEAILGLLERQFRYIILDPYSNAFNREANDRRTHLDDTSWTEEARPWIWERKYEVDSLCYPIRLAYHFWKTTGSAAWCGDSFLQAAKQILSTWETEQRHAEQSPYYFRRVCRRASDTLSHDGQGAPVGYTGMTWSGFRPSDDACQYGYLIPANFFAAKSLEQMEEIFEVLLPEENMIGRIRALREQIREGLRKYAVTEHPEFGTVYAYETDGMGQFNLTILSVIISATASKNGISLAKIFFSIWVSCCYTIALPRALQADSASSSGVLLAFTLSAARVIPFSAQRASQLLSHSPTPQS